MTKIDIFSGFLGAGKTTLIRKLIAEGYQGEKLVLIENEFGEIAIDGGFLKDAGVQITEMNSGCICCTLVGDFTKALKKVMEDFKPDRILIEPSGVGKLSDVAAAVERVEGAQIGAKVTVVDAGKCRMYMRNFGEFFNDQVANADLIVMSRTDTADEAKVLAAAETRAVAAVNSSHPLAGRGRVRVEELAGQELIFMEHAAPYSLQFTHALSRQGLEPAPFLTLQSPAMAGRLLEAGPYLSILPFFTVAQGVEAGRLAVLRVPGHRHGHVLQLRPLQTFAGGEEVVAVRVHYHPVGHGEASLWIQ